VVTHQLKSGSTSLLASISPSPRFVSQPAPKPYFNLDQYSVFLVEAVMNSIGHRLEQYTIKRPQEVLIVHAEIEGEPDEITIFKGFSSSLVRPTAFDPEVPMLPETAQIIAIDRLKSPYTPQSPIYLEQGLTWEQMQVLLAQVSV
jgi:hypothetical protein